MPCPFFEPQAVVLHPQHAGARLPLFDEYEGTCHASTEPVAVPSDLRFRFCNHGYSRGECAAFPLSAGNGCARFDLLHTTPDSLEILYVEERDHAPVRWQSLRFLPQTESLEPDPDDGCLRAQALAFCRGYLRHFRKIYNKI